VAQCKEDLDTFNHFINDNGALGRKARVATWFRVQKEGTLPPPPMDAKEVKLNYFFIIFYANALL
jgi:hypothetical protein